MYSSFLHYFWTHYLIFSSTCIDAFISIPYLLVQSFLHCFYFCIFYFWYLEFFHLLLYFLCTSTIDGWTDGKGGTWQQWAYWPLGGAARSEKLQVGSFHHKWEKDTYFFKSVTSFNRRIKSIIPTWYNLWFLKQITWVNIQSSSEDKRWFDDLCHENHFPTAKQRDTQMIFSLVRRLMQI